MYAAHTARVLAAPASAALEAAYTACPGDPRFDTLLPMKTMLLLPASSKLPVKALVTIRGAATFTCQHTATRYTLTVTVLMLQFRLRLLRLKQGDRSGCGSWRQLSYCKQELALTARQSSTSLHLARASSASCVTHAATRHTLNLAVNII